MFLGTLAPSVARRRECFTFTPLLDVFRPPAAAVDDRLDAWMMPPKRTVATETKSSYDRRVDLGRCAMPSVH